MCARTESCSTLCNSMGWGLLCPLNSPGKTTAVGCHFLLQGPKDPTTSPVSPALQADFFFFFNHLSHQRSPFCSLPSFYFLEEEMATHSSILAWKISWTEVPGGLQSVGSQRVGHDWMTLTFIPLMSTLGHKWIPT